MHDDNSWLRRPILPRPPALPQFGPEMRALIGLDPSDLEKDVASAEPSTLRVEADDPGCAGDTEHHELASVSEVHTRERVIRTGT